LITYKLPLAALGAAFFFALGWQAHPAPKPVTVVQTQVQRDVQVQTVDHVVTRTVTVKEREPNGTEKTTQTVDAAETKDIAKESQMRATQTVARVQADTAHWSLGVGWQPRVSPDVYKPVSAEIGYRVGGPVWLTGEWNWQTHSALVGARLEF
jgi:hypothetical protein